jgi:hypothetical protein
LLSGEDQSLLVRGNALLVLDLGLDIVDGVGRLNLEGYSLAREGLDEAMVYKSILEVVAETAKVWLGLHLHYTHQTC